MPTKVRNSQKTIKVSLTLLHRREQGIAEIFQAVKKYSPSAQPERLKINDMGQNGISVWGIFSVADNYPSGGWQAEIREIYPWFGSKDFTENDNPFSYENEDHYNQKLREIAERPEYVYTPQFGDDYSAGDIRYRDDD